ncbi:hypothetical protein Poly51_39450 [Rubripirellula tenax]|uniref:Four helix bundle protein n=1 Tax=Rubripirellula tenax TaxID=2528015 RepID=A0A5C6ENM9_9BACT|nr:four helix bundle protein [Rubripirellula tenax]TWU50652.1 hypothetical protein Poly51_39450 [Rubripirellula tenax]
MNDRICSHRDLIVYQKSFSAGKRIFELWGAFPREEMYSLTDQVRRSSRSVSANIAEAWRKRRYEKHFCSTLNIAESEAAETQVWFEYAAAHGYLEQKTAEQANDFYDELLRMIVSMIASPEKWYIGKRESKTRREEDTERAEKGVNEVIAAYLVNDAPEIDQFDLLIPSPTLRVSSYSSSSLSVSPPPHVSPSESPEDEDA